MKSEAQRVREGLAAAPRYDVLDARSRSPVALLDREERANQGSDELTVWCPCCLERTVPSRSGICLFCDTPLTAEAIERERESQPVVIASKSPANEPPAGIPAVFPEKTPRIPRRRDRRHLHGRPYSDEQILGRIKLWAHVVGSPPSKADWTPAKLRRAAATARGVVERHLTRVALYEMGDFPSETTVRDRFGSMNSALVQAGFEPRPTGRPPVSGKGTGLRPKIGRPALAEYMEKVSELLDGDQAQLKHALYDLSLSALYLADRIAVPEP